jgi:HEAT repeat protein
VLTADTDSSIDTTNSDSSIETSNESRANVVHSLRDLLNNGDEVDKCNASRALGTIGATEAINDLVIKLRDEDIDVCIDAAEALGKLNATHVVPQLIESLKNDPDGELKTAIVKALGDIKSPTSIPILIEIAEHHPEDMIIDSNEDWDDWWDMQKEAVLALGKMKAQPATQVLMNLLESDDVLDIEHVILNALVNIGEEGEQRVTGLLKEASALTRRRAAYALSFSSTKKSLKALSSAFTDASEDVRLYALQAMVTRKATKYLPAIELLKKDRSEKVRQAAIIAYNSLSAGVKSEKTDDKGNERLLNDPDADVRSTYLQSLQAEDVNLSDEELLDHITTAFNDQNEIVILAAIPLLLKLTNKESSEASLIQLISRPKISEKILRTCISTLAQISRWNVNISRIMTRLINHNDQPIRLTTLQALMDMEKSIEHTELDSTQVKTPIDIINETLNGRVVLEIEVSSLLPEQTENTSEDTEQSATEDESVEEAAPAEALSTLESIMQDSLFVEQNQQQQENQAEPETEEDPEMQEFHNLVQDNVTKSEWLFKNKNEEISVAQDVQHLAAKILAKLPDHLNEDKAKRTVDSLVTALNSADIKLSTYAADSIAQIAMDNPKIGGIEYAYGGLITQFHNEQWDLKLACIKALGTIHNRAAIPILMTAFEHNRTAIRIQAIESITELELNGDELLKNAHVPEMPINLTEWVNVLIDLLQDKDPGVRYSAVNNLKLCLMAEEINQQQELMAKAIEQIVQCPFNNQGGRTRDMALVLKAIEPVQGTARLVELLSDLPTSYERRFAIEMLEEMYRTVPLAEAS